MTEFLGSMIMFWGFIFFITGIFCITNIKIAGKVMRKTLKKILLIGLGVSLFVLLSVFVDFMLAIEMYALAIISSCWLIDLLNKARHKVDPEYNIAKFYLYDTAWSFSMTVMVCWYLAHIFTSDIGAILITIKFIILLSVIVLSAFGSHKLVKSTL